MLHGHMTSLPSREAILDLLAKNPSGLNAAELLAHFRLPQTKQEALLRFLDSMTFQGHLEAKDGARFRIPREEPKVKPAPRSKRPPSAELQVLKRSSRASEGPKDQKSAKPRRESDEPAVEIGFQVAGERSNGKTGPKKGLPPLGDPYARKGGKLPSPVAQATDEGRGRGRNEGQRKREERAMACG